MTDNKPKPDEKDNPFVSRSQKKKVRRSEKGEKQYTQKQKEVDKKEEEKTQQARQEAENSDIPTSPVTYSEELGDWFADIMIEHDLDIKGVYEQYPDEPSLPSYRVFLKWCDRYPDLQDKIDNARKQQVMRWRQELDNMANAEVDPNQSNNEIRVQMDQIKKKMDALKFKIRTISPLLAKEYNLKQKRADKETHSLYIYVTNYHKPNNKIKKNAKKIYEH